MSAQFLASTIASIARQDMEDVQEYVDQQRDWLESALTSHDTIVQVSGASASEGPYADPENWVDTGYTKFDLVFPRLAYASALVLAFATFERSLNVLCSVLDGSSSPSSGLSRTRGSTINKAIERVRGFHRINVPQEACWERIEIWREVRNLAAHSLLFLEDEESADERSVTIRVFAANNPSLVRIEEETQQLAVTAEGCTDLIKSVIEFWTTFEQANPSDL